MTLAEVSKFTEYQAREYMEQIRWPEGPVCAHCQSTDVAQLRGHAHRHGVYQCRECRQQFTVTTGSIMEDTHLPLRKWVLAFHLMCSSKKGVSSLQLQRNLGLGSYRSAWHLSHRIRYAMTEGPFAPLKGIVEVDETYVGGKTRKGIRGRGSERKTPVMVLVERNGKVRSRVIEHVTTKTLKGAIRETVDKQSRIMTDEWPSYEGIGKEFDGGHETVNHGRGEYVRGDVHVNTAESYFAPLKRGVMGTFHHLSKKHLHRYCNEFSFRWTYRKVDDGTRTESAIKGAEGKRLSLKEPVNYGSTM